MLLIIDNQSQYLKKFKREYLDEYDIPHMILEHNDQIKFDQMPEITGLMLSGGKGNPYQPLNLTTNYVAMQNFDVPTIGFCLGHEIIGVAYQARIKRLEEYQNKKQITIIDEPEDPIFTGLTESAVKIQKKHQYQIPDCPKDFKIIGHSEVCKVEIMKHLDKPIYGFQGHPEVSGKDGLLMMRNFLGLCGLQ